MSPADLSGRSVIVTGAGSGLGRTMALAFAAGGAAVYAADVDEPGLATTASAAAGLAGAIMTHPTDVSDEAAVAGLVDRVLAQSGQLDIYINNAATLGTWVPIGEQPAESFDRVFAVNVRGVLLGMKHAVRAMVPRRSGVIINLASVQGFRVLYPGSSLYSASKAAVVSLTKSGALEYGPQGIRVVGIAPGPIDTPMLRSAVGDAWPPPIVDIVPLGRVGESADIANAALWLASDFAAYISGAILTVDGGLLAP